MKQVLHIVTDTRSDVVQGISYPGIVETVDTSRYEIGFDARSSFSDRGILLQVKLFSVKGTPQTFYKDVI